MVMVSITTVNACTLYLIGAQMWLFGCILPLLIGDKVPDDDDKWKLLLNLIEIMDYLFSLKTRLHI